MGAWPLLTTSDLDLTLNRWDLTQTLSDTLGDLGTPADGFDSYLSETITLLSGLENLGGSLLEDLNLAAGIAGTIDPASLNSDAASLPASLAAGDAIVADANALLGSVGPPPPAGGGGGGGGGGPAAPPCDFTLIFGVGDNLPATQNVNFTNFLNVDMHISSKVVTQDVAGTFSETDSIPATLSPGATYGINVTYAARAALGTSGRLTIVSDSPTSPHTLCFTIGQADASVGSGSGGSSGGGGKGPPRPSPYVVRKAGLGGY